MLGRTVQALPAGRGCRLISQRRLPQCPHAPCRGRGYPQCQGVRAPGLRQAASGVRPVSARCPRVWTAGICRARRPGPLDQRRRASATCARCRRAGTAAAGLPPSCRSRPGSRTPRPVDTHRLRNRTPRTLWLSAAASGTAVGVRTVGVRRVGVRTAGVRRGHCRSLWCPRLQEAVARPAATGRVPPLLVGAGELALQPVAKLGADQGHGRSLHRQGFLGGHPAQPQAQQVAAPPAGHHRPGGRLRVDPDLGPRCHGARRAAPR
jgi:hypothetical protein